MKKWCLVLLFILLCSSIVISVPSCDRGDGCKLGCVNGDSDCTCSAENGFLCTETQGCKGVALNNWGAKMCCSSPCVDSNNKADVKVNDLSSTPSDVKLNIESIDEKKPSGLNNSAVFKLISIITVIIFILVIVRVIYKPKPKSLFVLETMFDAPFEQYKYKHEPSNLLKGAMEHLNSEERLFVSEVHKNEGLTLDEYRDNLKFSLEKINSLVIKLERKQLIKSKGTDIRLFISDWLR
ncbi:MAG: hypothetical protein AABW52_04715 [Nanoarchaeota archaeon]